MIPLASAPTAAARAALLQATARWPQRNRASDGLLPSSAHLAQNSDSDHNNGYAFDLTNDPAHGVDCPVLAEQLRLKALAGRDPRVKYVIWDRRITSVSWGFSGWHPYGGVNPHDHHMHVSIEPGYGHDTSPWWDFEEDDDMAMTPAERKAFIDDVADAAAAKVWAYQIPVDAATRKQFGYSKARYAASSLLRGGDARARAATAAVGALRKALGK